MKLKVFVVFWLLTGSLFSGYGCNGNPTGTQNNTVYLSLTPTPPNLITVTPTNTPYTISANNKNICTTNSGSQNVTVGSYIVESNYWNSGSCPGTQCMNINPSTASFSVTQGPSCSSCNTVASYPNVLYGCNGICSPSSVLPMPVSALNNVTSSWSFAPGGNSNDCFDIAYDIWFCSDNSCSGGFNNGAELMIWVNYQNTTGWKTHLGSVSLSGYNWDVWTATQTSGSNSWTYIAYLISSNVTSVTNLNLLAFIQDSETRNLIQNTWYLYAVQAGNEIRSGGLPFNNNSFSVSIN